MTARDGGTMPSGVERIAPDLTPGTLAKAWHLSDDAPPFTDEQQASLRLIMAGCVPARTAA